MDDEFDLDVRLSINHPEPTGFAATQALTECIHATCQGETCPLTHCGETCYGCTHQPHCGTQGCGTMACTDNGGTCDCE